MWLLPSRNRPKSIERFIKAWKDTKASTPLILIVDDDDQSIEIYQSLELPDEWFLQIFPGFGSLGKTLNHAYKMYPNEPFYGMVADDVLPSSEGWDTKLIEACGTDYLSFGDDGANEDRLATHPCIGGNIVRKLGFISLPGCVRLFMDTALTTYAQRNRLIKYLPDVKMEHLHFSYGKSDFDETYKKSDPAHDEAVYKKWVDDTFGTPVFVCVNWSNYGGCGAKYVNILYDSVRRNLRNDTEGKFICFTDDATNFNEGITAHPLPEGIDGWYNKLFLFNDGLFEKGERIIYIDLDTCIVDSLDDIIEYNGEFAALRDFYQPDNLASGVMLWKAGFGADIYQSWLEAGKPVQEMGDQEWIAKWCMKNNQKVDYLQDIFPKSFVSFKIDAQFELQRTTKLVCFHGNPKPHDIEGGWVEQIWKIGGGSVMHQKVICNTDASIINRNVHHACSLAYENLAGLYMAQEDKHVAIVGGGPSLAGNIYEIKIRKDNGQKIWALNNSYQFLVDNGIMPDAHIMMDARPENAEFVPAETSAMLLYASQCDPLVFEKAALTNSRIIIWHPYISGMIPLMNKLKRQVAFVGAGSSVGMKAIGLAQLFGFKHVHLYGYDSSYRGDQNHAYPQPLNDHEMIIDVVVNGEKFRCAPWMATQAEEFRHASINFMKHGMEFTVHGDGLLPYVASLI